MSGIPAGEEVAVDIYPRVERTFLQRFFSEMVNDDWEDTALRRLPGLHAVLEAAGLPSGVPLTWLPYRIDIR
jgi:hypothetical protein